MFTFSIWAKHTHTHTHTHIYATEEKDKKNNNSFAANKIRRLLGKVLLQVQSIITTNFNPAPVISYDTIKIY